MIRTRFLRLIEISAEFTMGKEKFAVQESRLMLTSVFVL